MDSTHPRRAWLAAMLVPLALLLSGCQMNSAFTVTAGGGLISDIEFSDETGTLKRANVNCASFGVAGLGQHHDLTAEDISTTGEVACRIHGFSDNAVDNNLLTDNGSTYTLTLNPSDVNGLARILPELQSAPGTFSLTVKMPGKIVDATPGGVIDGNKITYTDAIVLTHGEIVVEGNKSDGLPASVWVLVLLGAMIAIVGLVSWWLRRRRAGGVDDGDPDDASVVTPSKGARSKLSEADEHAQKMAPASTSRSAVRVNRGDGELEEDSESAESYSEEIGMVNPQLHGKEANAVMRANALPEIPAASTHTSPIPGMPPRMPMPNELYAGYDSAEGAAVPAIPQVPAIPDVPPDYRPLAVGGPASANASGTEGTPATSNRATSTPGTPADGESASGNQASSADSAQSIFETNTGAEIPFDTGSSSKRNSVAALRGSHHLPEETTGSRAPHAPSASQGGDASKEQAPAPSPAARQAERTHATGTDSAPEESTRSDVNSASATARLIGASGIPNVFGDVEGESAAQSGEGAPAASALDMPPVPDVNGDPGGDSAQMPPRIPSDPTENGE